MRGKRGKEEQWTSKAGPMLIYTGYERKPFRAVVEEEGERKREREKGGKKGGGEKKEKGKNGKEKGRKEKAFQVH